MKDAQVAYQESHSSEQNDHLRIKIFLLSIIFLFVIGAYTVIYDVKNSIFVSTVGKEYIPWAKMLSMFILIPAVLFYSFLVDKLRRYQLLCFYAILYGLFGLLCIYLIGHPVIGLPNTDSSPFRLFGWAFYFLVEGFSPFVVSVFWAFSNSVNSPQEAKQNYGTLVLGSKVGGMISAGFAWSLLRLRTHGGERLFTDSVNHQLLLGFFSFLVLLVPLFIYIFIKKVPSGYLHGYEAVYKFETKKQETDAERPGLLGGLIMLFQRPYILGIFSMLFFYEILNTILSYQRLGVAQSVATSVSDLSYELYKQMFYMHALGFFISLFGTRSLLKYFGEKICLMLVPIVSGILLFYFWVTYTPGSLLIVFLALKSVNYAFATPLRESLYIPTIKEVKFKSKSWIDAFGSKMARFTGSGFNVLTDLFGGMVYFPLFGAIILLWFVAATLLGRRYEQAISRNEVIT